MRIPGVANPERYVGLYVYDFGTHVSIGYTASEVCMLRESPAHRGGTAYEIYRVHETGGFELRGAVDSRLRGREALCFLRGDSQAARRDYDELRRMAKTHRLPCAAELHLARIDSFELPHVTAVLYAASATSLMATWLSSIGFAGGDHVIGGVDACAEFLGADRVGIDSCDLPASADCRDRTVDEVLSSVDVPVQR